MKTKKKKAKKIQVATPQEVMRQVQELKSLDSEQLGVYLEARNCGACHDDAMDAVVSWFGVAL